MTMPNEPAEMREGWTKGPLHVEQRETWPFNLAIMAPDGEAVGRFSRYATSSRMNTIEDCLLAVGFSGEDFTQARDGNRRQLADLTLWASAPELYEALSGTLALAELYAGNLDESANVLFDKARAALAKARGQ